MATSGRRSVTEPNRASLGRESAPSGSPSSPRGCSPFVDDANIRPARRGGCVRELGGTHNRYRGGRRVADGGELPHQKPRTSIPGDPFAEELEALICVCAGPAVARCSPSRSTVPSDCSAEDQPGRSLVSGQTGPERYCRSPSQPGYPRPMRSKTAAGRPSKLTEKKIVAASMHLRTATAQSSAPRFIPFLLRHDVGADLSFTAACVLRPNPYGSRIIAG